MFGAKYRQVLGVTASASLGEVKSAYLALCKRHHPDLNQHDAAAATIKFRQVTEAWKYLSTNPTTTPSAPTPPTPQPQSPSWPKYDFSEEEFARQHHYSYHQSWYQNPFQTVNGFERWEKLKTVFPAENLNRFKKLVQRYVQGGNDRINNLAWATKIIESALQAEQRKIKKTNAYNMRFANLSKLFPHHDVSKFRSEVEAYLKGKDPLHYDLHWATLLVERLVRIQAGKSKPQQHPKQANKRKRVDDPRKRRLFRYAYPGHFYEEF
ncbi:hypothetical protein BASA81_010733 [Batrachochytrium salamandrivorans]|nr:hypothetical protein BASA81_010733 [Batrachochytrium salamandrivorans]